MQSRSDTTPILISSKNALEMTGQSWRWWRDHAETLGLDILRVDGKSFMRAADALRALERRAAPEADAEPLDELAEMRRRIAGAG